MASLTGNKIKDTYKGLIKTTDNAELSASAKELTDGNGNGSGVSLDNAGNVTATATVTANAFVGDGSGLTNLPSGAVSSVNSQTGAVVLNTDNIAEGSTNQYFTTVRAVNAVTGGNLDMGSYNITTTGKIYFANVFSTEGDLPSASTYHGMFAHVHATGKAYFAHAGSWHKLLDEDSSNTDDLSEGSSNLYFTDGRVSANSAVTANTAKVTRRPITAGGNTLETSESLTLSAGSNVTITETGGTVTIASSGGAGSIDLGTSTTTTSATVTNSGGTDATISEASGTAAGVMSTAHHDKLDGIAAGAEVNPTNTDGLTEGSSNLYYTEARVNANTNVTANTAKNTYPSADATKVGHLTVTQAVDLDAIDTAVTANTAKVTRRPVVAGGNTLDTTETLTFAAGSNVSITEASGTVTISSSGGAGGGDITAVAAGDGLTGGGTTGDVSLAVGAGALIDVTADAVDVDLTELTDMTSAWDNSADEFVVLDGGTAQKRKLSSEIFGSNAFNSTTIPTNNNQLTNGAGYTTLALGATSTTALAGDTTTISGSQASAITANTAKISFDSTSSTKLGTIETNADVTDATNVTAALVAATGISSGDKTTILSNIGAGSGAVDSVNGATGTVVLDADNIDDTSTTHKFTTAANLTKLSNIEDNADVTDATNVTAAGALMDSEVVNLAQVKAFNSSDYATAAQGTKADAALPDADVSTFAKTLLDDTSASAMRSTIGAGTSNLVIGTSSTEALAGNTTIPTNNNQLTNGAGYTTNAGTVTSVSSSTTNQLTVASGTSTPALSVVTGTVADAGTALATGDQIHTFVTGQGYLTSNQTVTLSGDVTGSGTTAITATIADNVVGADELNVSGNGTSGQVLASDGDGTFSWADAASGGGGITPSVISTNTTAVKDYLYVLTASLTLTLPASPSAGDSLKVVNLSNVATCVIARNSSNIMGAAEDLTLDNVNANFEIIYAAATQGWVLVGAN